MNEVYHIVGNGVRALSSSECVELYSKTKREGERERGGGREGRERGERERGEREREKEGEEEGANANIHN